MDDNFYASLLDTSTEAPSESAALLSVLVSRRTGSTSRNLSSTSVRIVAAARIPRKRTGYDDPVKYTLQYFSFLDDKRRFTNLDSLLTRLSPVKVVHVGCNESIKLNSSSSSMNKSQQLRSQEISDLLSKVATVINTRNDILPLNANDESVSTNIVENLPNDISNASTIQLDSILSPLLGGASNPRFQAYKNDTNIMDDTLIQQGIAFLVYMENLKCQSDSDDSLGEYELAAGDLTSFLLMDRTAMECINLLPSSHDGISSLVIGGTQSNNSIFGILNKCKTKMGVRLLEMWLRQPSTDLKTILYRQSAVSKMVEDDSVGRDRLRSEGIGSLRGVDLDTLCDKMDRFSDVSSGIGATTKALECLYKLHQFADRQLPPIVAALSDMAGTEESQGIIDGDNIGALECSLHGLSLVLNELSRSVQLVETILDFDLAPREFLVKPSFNDALIELRSDLINVDDELDRLHSDMNALWSEVTNQSLGQVRLEACDSSSSSSGKDSACAWQFRLIDANSIKTLQEHPQFKGLVTVHRILKNGVYFSTKELRQLGDKKFDLLKEYDNHQREIVNNAMSVAVTYIPVLERASSIIAELDVLSSLAHVAAYSPNGYCRPEMTDGEEDGLGIQLKAARHPCVELQENVDFIPNDFQLTYGSSCFLLVTGPNMGGKSTYIRSLGAIITMAQIGSYVPCSSAKINIVHHLLARVGAGDAQHRGISTFFSEMLEASSILRTATKRSLIIIDELGRGTSTFDGFGLASAISEYIVQRIGCMTLFATHFHELTALEEKESSVNNCHVTARKATDGTNGLSFLYEIRPGPCLESFGIQVAEMANVPKSVIVDAKRKAKELENFEHYSKKRICHGDHVSKEESNYEHDVSDDLNKAREMINNFKNIPYQSLRTVEEKKEAIRKILQQ